jgi:hypothetical protein
LTTKYRVSKKRRFPKIAALFLKTNPEKNEISNLNFGAKKVLHL